MRRAAASLTQEEQRACASLLKVNCHAASVPGHILSDEYDSDDSGNPVDMTYTLKRVRERATKVECPYINCNFIYGSASQVEWLWSIAKHILSDKRARLSPHLFETLLFLKVNDRFWDQALVMEAIKIAKSNAKSTRLTDFLRETEEQEQEAATFDEDDTE